MDLLKWNKYTGEFEALQAGDKLSGDFVEATFDTDVTVTDAAKGIVLTSASKTWRITIDDTGTLVITDITPL